MKPVDEMTIEELRTMSAEDTKRLSVDDRLEIERRLLDRIDQLNGVMEKREQDWRNRRMERTR